MDTEAPRSEPSLLRWEQLSYTQLQALDRQRAAVVLSCSPLEVHGPHLPLGTDLLEAQGLAERFVAYLPSAHQERPWLMLPPLFLGADTMPWSGSIEFRPGTVHRAVLDLGRSLAKQGFQNIFVSNLHGGPRHFVAIEDACRRVSGEHGVKMVSVFSLLLKTVADGAVDPAAFLGDVPGLDKRLLQDDIHAGFMETSLMLALLPEHVDPAYRELPRQTFSSWLQARGERALSKAVGEPDWPWEMWRGFRTLARYSASELYCGDPAAASAEQGELLLASISQKVAAGVVEVLEGRIDPASCVSPLHPLRHLLLHPWAVGVVDWLLKP